MKDRVAACIYPDSTSCRGCSYSFNPTLFDGGCMLQYGAQGDSKSLQGAQGDSKSLQPDKRTTAGERHEENSEIKRGIYPREDSRT